MGYRFSKTASNLQVQSKTIVKDTLATRLQGTFEGGVFAVTSSRPATTEERISRRLSARETSGARTNQINQIGDYTVLPESSRDVYLTSSYGLTSLYPTILLTSPRTSKVVDVDTGLTTTPFIIDINNEIKKIVERDVKAVIDQNTSLLQLTTAQYDQNVQSARQYADLCLQTALIKDRLISLLNIISISTTNQGLTQGYTINGEDYQFLSGKQNIFEFLKENDELGQISLEDWEIGSNTKNVAQILKLLTEQIVLGKTEVPYSDESIKTTLINGRNSPGTVDRVKKLQTINPATELDEFTGRTLIYYDAAANIRNIRMSDYQDGTAENITDMVRLVQRDLIIQSVKEQLISLVNVRSRNIEDALAQIVGKYKDYRGQSTPFIDSLDNGVNNVNDFIQSSNAYDAINLLVANIDGRKIGKIDLGEGTDYLINNNLVQTATAPAFQEIINFSNDYAAFTLKLRLFYQLIYRDDDVRKTVVKNIRDMLLTFINGSKIDTDDLASNASATRIGCFMAAAYNDDVAKKLFRLMCVLDKINNYGLNTPADHPQSDELNGAINALIREEDVNRGIERGAIRPPSDKEWVYENSGLMPISAEEVTYGDFSIEKEYFEQVGSVSFLNFHNLARRLEQNFLGESYTQNERNEDYYKKATLKTDFSLGLSRDARAFVFYAHFLDMLRQCSYKVNIEDYYDYEMTIEYRPAEFKLLKFIAENYDVDSETLSRLAFDFATDKFTTDQNFGTAVVGLRNKYFGSPIEKINNQEQTCLDIINILASHASQIGQTAQQFKSNVNEIYRIASTNNLVGRYSLLNDTQIEQAFLKKNIVDRYSSLLRGASYLPSAIDHNVGQALNTKTVVATYPNLNDPLNEALTRKFLIAVGIPTGLMEALRYQNIASTSEHLYSIDLTFKNLQITQEEEEASTFEAFVTRGYTFSTRIFVNEGSQLIGGADTKASELTNYSQIYSATKYKVIDDGGNYRDIDFSDLERIIGDRKIIDNHLMSHYAKLLLKTTAGFTLEEEVFDLVPQVRRYPDSAQDANYTTIVDLITDRYPNTPEGQLNKERVLRDISRSIQLAPDQHKTSMMVSKTFERIHVIPIDVSDIINQLQIRREDIAFLDVFANIRLEDSQPPIAFEEAPTRRSYASARQDALTIFRETDVRSQGIDSTGINAAIESSNRFGGLLGGNNR